MPNKCKNCEERFTEIPMMGKTNYIPYFICRISVNDVSLLNVIKSNFEQMSGKTIGGGADCPYIQRNDANLTQNSCIFFETN